MNIRTKDEKRYISIDYETWFCLYSTVKGRIETQTDELNDAIDFLKDMKCQWNDGLKIARQINLIRDKLSLIEPDEAIYNIDDRTIQVPWKGNLSPVITSCANMFTTSDGKDLLYEIVSILCYSAYTKNDVIC